MEKIIKYIQQHEMLQQGDCVIAGISGGADSVFLLWVLKELRPVWNLTVAAVHVHHGIRGKQADLDEAYVQKLCRQWKIPCHCVHVDVPLLAKEQAMTIEEAGRKARYDAFHEVATQYKEARKRIAVAHHMDDNAETILMNLFRGSGLKGISGMQPVRGNLIRPLLCVKRSEIETFLEQQKIAWCTDSTNLETDYTRNKIRLQILPAIYKVFPQAGEHILQTGKVAGETDQFLNHLACEFMETHAVIGYHKICWNREAFAKQDIVMQKIILRQGFLQVGLGLKDITSRHIEEICLLAQKNVGKFIQLPGGWQAENGYTTICICMSKEKVTQKMECWQMETCIFPYEMENYKKSEKFPENEYTKWFDYDKIKDGVVLRTRQTGDIIQVHPKGSKKLKDYMIDAKIPRDIRDAIPVVASGNQILWVVGYRISEAFKVSAQTKNIIQVAIKVSDCNCNKGHMHKTNEHYKFEKNQD